MSKHVLLIDSDSEMIDIYARGLVIANYEVSAASSAQAALDALDELDIDLVVTEIVLPVHNGLSVIYELISYTDWAKIPIIVLSSVPKRDFNSPEKLWKKLNIKDYLYKLEVRPAGLATVVKKVLNEDS